MSTPRKRALIAILAATVGLLGALGAYAYWTTSGSGTGSAQAGTTSTITVNQTTTRSGLYPGGSVALAGNFTNGNAFPVYVANVTATVNTFSVQPDTAKPACTQADFTITGTAVVNAQIRSGAASAPGAGCRCR